MGNICIFLTVLLNSLIYTIDINQEIDKRAQLYLKNGLAEAERLQADAVLLHLNTYGGLLDAADSMRTAILYNPLPVYVFIDNNAASAGALLSLASRGIYMRKGASIGAATVVNQTGAPLPDKYQSYMRAMMRATAEAHGKDTVVQGCDTVYRWKRDPRIAEAMVDERVVIPHLIDSGKVLTLTADEAVQWGYCEGIAETEEEVISRYLGFHDYTLRRYEPSWLDNLKGFLMNPAIQAVLVMLIVGGIYFELQSPGMGFPSVAAGVAAVLYFAPLYLDGLAQNWEILLFVCGLLLLAVELFVLPGFGVAGIGGIVCVFGGLTMGLLNNTDFDFGDVSGTEAGRAALIVLVGLLLGIVLVFWFSRRIGKRGWLRRVALAADLGTGGASPALDSLVGKEGVATTVLRPSGKVAIDDVVYDGVSEAGFLERGTKVRVVRFENAQVYVDSVR